MAFKIRYKFTGETQHHTCTVTFEQYKNFRELAIVSECEILKGNQENIEEYKKEMERALELAVKNDKGHILKLSENS